MHEDVQQFAEPPAPKRKPRSTATLFLIELGKFALIAIFVVLPVRLYVAQPFIVSGSSMVPTFEDGEYLVVDELSYHFDDPERGEVIIFKYPLDPSKFFIKRVIGLPHEEVRIKDGKVTIINDANPEGFLLNEPYLVEMSHEAFKTVLSGDEYFVMGDNRPASSDSRVWGALDRDFIIGRAFLRLLPVTRADVLPGNVASFN